MAPDADLLAVKVLGYVIGTGSTSQIIKGLEIASEWDADVISMSLGGPSETETAEEDPFYPVMEHLVNEEQRIVVVAAGNEGPEPNTISSPGSMPQVLTVGAYDPIKGEIAEFSSRGPTNWGDIKPDVVAPGVNILSASVGLLDYAVEKVADRYGILSGTSMATPHVAGLAVLMRQAHENLLRQTLTVDEIKKMMAAWAIEQGIEKNNDYGWGPITWDIYEWWLSTQYSLQV
jgi:subtilisin family serine protease